MKSNFFKTLIATPVLGAMLLTAQDFGATSAVPAVWHPDSQSATAQSVAETSTARVRHHRRVHRRSKKKSAVIIGGSGLAGAGIGALAGGKKGAIIGGAAGAGAGYVYDRKTQKKPIIPK